MPWLTAARKGNAAVTVMVRRNGIASAPIVATKGTSEFIRETGEGPTINWHTSDYLIAVADYVIDGVTVQPKVGDLIEETIGDVVTTDQVANGPGQQCWRYSDRGETQYRIHTQRT